MASKAVYPGTFNPPTVAHLAIARAALEELDITQLDIPLSRTPFGKSEAGPPNFDQRLQIAKMAFSFDDRITVYGTDLKFLSDISAGYTYLIIGDDKLAQLTDLQFYRDPEEMAVKLASLPELVVVERSRVASDLPFRALSIDPSYREVSSTRVRNGETDLIAESARLTWLLYRTPRI